MDLRDYMKVHAQTFEIVSFNEGNRRDLPARFTLEASRGFSLFGVSLRLHVVDGEAELQNITDGLNVNQGVDAVAGRGQLNIGNVFYLFHLAELAYFHVDFDNSRAFVAIHPVRLVGGGERNLGFYLRIDNDDAQRAFRRAQTIAGFSASGIRFCTFQEQPKDP